MSSLPGFSKVNTISHVEIDQPFEKSMQQLNENQKYYVFPEDANIINKKGQILEWKNSSSSDVYLYPIDATTFQDKYGLQYHLSYNADLQKDVLWVQNEINVVVDWEENTRFINTHTGERYDELYSDDTVINISAESSEEILKIPFFLKGGGGCFQIKHLNCSLDLTTAIDDIIYNLTPSDDLTIQEPGKIIVTSQQKEILVGRGNIVREVDGVFWFINPITGNDVLRMEVQP